MSRKFEDETIKLEMEAERKAAIARREKERLIAEKAANAYSDALAESAPYGTFIFSEDQILVYKTLLDPQDLLTMIDKVFKGKVPEIQIVEKGVMRTVEPYLEKIREIYENIRKKDYKELQWLRAENEALQAKVSRMPDSFWDASAGETITKENDKVSEWKDKLNDRAR